MTNVDISCEYWRRVRGMSPSTPYDLPTGWFDEDSDGGSVPSQATFEETHAYPTYVANTRSEMLYTHYEYIVNVAERVMSYTFTRMDSLYDMVMYPKEVYGRWTFE